MSDLEISIEIQGDKKLADALSSSRVFQRVPYHLLYLANYIAGQVRAFAPERTGALKSSIKANAVSPFMYTITEGVAYGKYQRLGTKKKDYPIYPRNRKALWWPGLAHPIPWVGEPYTREHPGIRGIRYDLLGLATSIGEIHNTAFRIGLDAITAITG